MTCRNELGAEKLLVWITEIPFEGKPRQSSNFSLMESEWHLLFTYRKNDLFHVLSLHRVTVGEELELAEFKAKIYITNPTEAGDTENDVMTATVQQPETTLWYSSAGNREKIFNTLPSLYEKGDIKFVCKFYGQPQSAFQLEIRTEDQSPNRTRTIEKSVQVSSEVLQGIESLSSDFSLLLEKEILPDMRLECGGRTLKTHRSVLAARSRVFRAMFQNGMLESETGAVKVQDVDFDVLEKLLKFVYTGKPEDLSEGTAADLYEAADKYAVLSLKTACGHWVARNLTVQNCVKHLVVADSHSDHDLKAAVMSFITENPSVMKSEAWLELSRKLPVLANEVFQTYVASTVP